jgi:hypothetical protein
MNVLALPSIFSASFCTPLSDLGLPTGRLCSPDENLGSERFHVMPNLSGKNGFSFEPDPTFLNQKSILGIGASHVYPDHVLQSTLERSYATLANKVVLQNRITNLLRDIKQKAEALNNRKPSQAKNTKGGKASKKSKNKNKRQKPRRNSGVRAQRNNMQTERAIANLKENIYNLPYVSKADIIKSLEAILECDSPSFILSEIEIQLRRLQDISKAGHPEGYWRNLREQKEHELVHHIIRLGGYEDYLTHMTQGALESSRLYIPLHKIPPQYMLSVLLDRYFLDLPRYLPNGDIEAVEYYDHLLKRNRATDIFKLLSIKLADSTGMAQELTRLLKKGVRKNDAIRAVVLAHESKINNAVRTAKGSVAKKITSHQASGQKLTEVEQERITQVEVDKEIGALLNNIIQNPEDEFAKELFYEVRGMLRSCDRTTFAKLLSSDNLTNTEKNFFLEIIYTIGAQYARYVIRLGLKNITKREVASFLATGFSGSGLTATVSAADAKIVIPAKKAVNVTAQTSDSVPEPRSPGHNLELLGVGACDHARAVIDIHQLLLASYESNLNYLSEAEKKVVKVLIDKIPAMTTLELEMLSYIQKTYGDDVLVAFIFNASLLLEGYTEVGFVSDNDKSTRYLYDFQRVIRSLKIILNSIPAYFDTTGRHSLNALFDLKSRDTYRVSFVTPSVNFNTDAVIPLSGWIKEMQMVAQLKQEPDSEIVWEPADNESYVTVFGLDYVAPDALDVRTGTLIEVMSCYGSEIRLNSMSFIRKRDQLLRYKRHVRSQHNVHGVKLIVIGKMNIKAQQELCEIMKGVDFEIVCVDYHTLS